MSAQVVKKRIPEELVAQVKRVCALMDLINYS